MYAAALCREVIVDTILRKNPDLCARNNSNETVLMIAASYGHVSIIDQLILNAQQRTNSSRTPKKNAIFREISGMDLVNNSGFTALHFAVYFNHQTAVEYLLKIGANPDIPDQDGMTPTLLACGEEVQHPCLRALIKAGGNLSLKNKAGKTGFDIGHRETIKKLVANVLDGNRKTVNSYGNF